jgi:hypothetical protein
MGKTTALLLASAGFIALHCGQALAGPCTDQIADVRKRLSSTDAGSGPTLGANPSKNENAATTGAGNTSAKGAATPPSGTASAPAGGGAGTPGSTASVPSGSGSGQGQKAGEAPKTDATVAMNTATQGSAASPQDVRAQIQGQPTAAQAAQSTSQGGGAAPQGDRAGQINAALERARLADEQGKGDDCTTALNDAKRLMQ